MTRSRVATWIVAGFVIAAPGQAGDLLRPLNSDPSENGALVDGSRNTIQVNDRRFVELDLGGLFNTLFPVIPLENFVPSPGSNEVLAFSRGHPPALIENVPWTAVSDTINIQFEDEYQVAVTVWIVKEDGLPSALNGNVTTSAIWKDERQGVAFDTFDIVPAWDNPSAPDFHEFNCNLGTEIKAAIGHIPGRVNIYYVDRVDFGSGPSTSNGVWCGSQIVAMGRNSSGHLLAHELGHAFALGHSNQANDADQFDKTNVMHNASGVREFLTEGQTYRATFHPGSALNNIYVVRDGAVTRSCGTNEFSDVCPKLFRRVWADGPTWPAN